MSLIAGSYERFIWGFKLKSPKDPHTLDLIPLFSFPSHLSTIKCVAVSGSAAVSSGADDTVKIYDLSTTSEIGSLLCFSTVTSLAFYTPPSLSFPRNLIAGSEDGSVSIYDTDPFVHLKTVEVHSKGVNSLAIHPSGKLALTVGRDNRLAMVNLMRGSTSYRLKLRKEQIFSNTLSEGPIEASCIQFSEKGESFFMVMDDKISVHEAEDAKLVSILEGKGRVLCAAPGMNGLLFTGGEDRGITAWDTKSGKVAYSIEDAHSARVKGIVVLSKGSDGASVEDDPYIVASASSDGVIRVWDVRAASEQRPNALAEVNTKSRLTCLAGSSAKCVRRPRIGDNRPNKKQEIDYS